MDKVDISNALLNNALKQRQGFMYNLASTLANTPVQQGYGSWLSNLTNAFGRAYQGGIDSDVERQKAQDLSNALQSEKLSDAAKVAAIYGDTGLAQQLLTAQATNDYRQSQLEESRLNREFNRAIKEQELAQKAAEDEAQRQYYLDQLGLKRDELAGTQEYRTAQLDIDRAGVDIQRVKIEQDAAKLAQQAAENEAQRAYLMEKLGTETQLSQADQALKQAQLEQTGAYNTARLAQEQAKLDNAMSQQKAVSDYYTGKNVDYSKLPVKILEQLAKEKEAQKAAVGQYMDLPNLKLHDLNQSAGSWSTYRYDPSNKEQGWFTRQGTALLRGRDYGLDKSNKTKRATDYEKFETVAMKGMYDVLKMLRPATDTDVLTALKSAGADPTMLPETRDVRLTGVLNGELRKAGLQKVENLENWDETVEYANKYGVWNPVAAKQARLDAEQKTENSATSTNTISVGGVRNGYRFKGGDPNKKENWEKI